MPVWPYKLVSGTGSATVLHLSQSFPSKRGGKARPQTGFHFTVQKMHVPGSSGSSLGMMPHLESGTETHTGGKKSAGDSVSASSAEARKWGASGLALLMFHSPQPPHHPNLIF